MFFLNSIISSLFILGSLAPTSANAYRPQIEKHQDLRNGMYCITADICVDPKMTRLQQNQFLQTVGQSKVSISNFFGSLQSAPKIYACTTKLCFLNFGGVQAHAKAIGDDTILLSSKALNTISLTHEWAHIELHRRLGSSEVWNRVPMWFDEGLAAIICQDPRFNISVEEASLSELMADFNTEDQWVSAVRARVPAYSIARQAVQKWYQAVGTHGLHSLINKMRNGHPFSSSTDPKFWSSDSK